MMLMRNKLRAYGLEWHDSELVTFFQTGAPYRFDLINNNGHLVNSFWLGRQIFKILFCISSVHISQVQ